MSVTSRTTKSVLPLKLTSANFRVEAPDGGNTGAGCTAEQVSVRALDADVGGPLKVGVAAGTGVGSTPGDPWTDGDEVARPRSLVAPQEIARSPAKAAIRSHPTRMVVQG